MFRFQSNIKKYGVRCWTDLSMTPVDCSGPVVYSDGERSSGTTKCSFNEEDDNGNRTTFSYDYPLFNGPYNYNFNFFENLIAREAFRIHPIFIDFSCQNYRCGSSDGCSGVKCPHIAARVNEIPKGIKLAQRTMI